MARPKKSKLPINLETFLRIALPKKRPEDRMKLFREFAKSNLIARLGKMPTEEETQTDFQSWCQVEFKNAAHIDNLCFSVKDFVPQFVKYNRINRARIAATERWAKKNNKSA